MHSGFHGLTRCPCSSSVCHVSLVKSCTTSPTLTLSGVLGELQESVSRLDLDGFITRLCWDMLHAHVQAVCVPELSPPNGPSRACAARLVATVRRNTKLRDMNISVPATDDRSIEVLASGLELNHGAQLAVDITVQSAVTACGRARPNASTVDGAVLTEARHDKEAKYAELCQGG